MRLSCLPLGKFAVNHLANALTAVAMNLLSTHVRPPEANNQAFPGHREGDLNKGASNRSVVVVLVERSSRLVMLIKLADATAASALQGFTAKLRKIAEPMRQTLTYDHGK